MTKINVYELIKRADKAGLLCQSGWKRKFVDCYIYDYDWMSWNRFTKDEMEELKSFQKDMRNALDTIDKMRYERYRNGTMTREDVVRLLDKQILDNIEQWGEDDIYTKWAKERKHKVLHVYDNNLEPVVICKIDWYHKNGFDYEEVLFTNGKIETHIYSAD